MTRALLLGERFFSSREFFDAVEARGIANSWARRNANGALQGHFHLRLNHILGPVTAARGDVAGEREISERRQGDVMRAAYPGFEHPPAPDRNLLRLATIVNLARSSVPAHAAKLDVDNPTGAQFDRRAGMLIGMDAFIETDRGLKFSLKFRVAVEVVPAKRLLDHHEVIGLETLQVRPIFKLVRRIRVDHQTNVWEAMT